MCASSRTVLFITLLVLSIQSRQLQSCSKDCLVCTSPTTCTACSQSYYLSMKDCYPCTNKCTVCTSNLNCSACEKGYFLTSSRFCLQCPASCLECTSLATCTACESGFYLNYGVCSRCSTGCESCSNPRLCNVCLAGYKRVDSGKCQESSVSGESPSSFGEEKIIVIVIGVIIFLGLIFAVIYFFFRRKTGPVAPVNQSRAINSAQLGGVESINNTDDNRRFRPATFYVGAPAPVAYRPPQFQHITLVSTNNSALPESNTRIVKRQTSSRSNPNDDMAMTPLEAPNSRNAKIMQQSDNDNRNQISKEKDPSEIIRAH